MDEEYLTCDQAAEKLQLDPRTIRRFLISGILPGRKLGPKEWRIPASQLHEFMMGRKPMASVKAEPARKRRSGD